MLDKQCLICKFIPPKLYKHMYLTTRLYGNEVDHVKIHIHMYDPVQLASAIQDLF